MIQLEMEDQAAWAAKPPQQRRERERLLHQLEGSATTYTTLSKNLVALFDEFTAETKAPFMTPEIVDRLAAMLTYNLDALVGPKCQNLKVKNPDKYKFNPRQLLSDILQVYLNLSDQGEFVKAVAGEGRSYRKELFERAAGIANRKTLKTEAEIEQLRLFVVKVDEMKATIEADDDLRDPRRASGCVFATRLQFSSTFNLFCQTHSCTCLCATQSRCRLPRLLWTDRRSRRIFSLMHATLSTECPSSQVSTFLSAYRFPYRLGGCQTPKLRRRLMRSYWRGEVEAKLVLGMPEADVMRVEQDVHDSI